MRELYQFLCQKSPTGCLYSVNGLPLASQHAALSLAARLLRVVSAIPAKMKVIRMQLEGNMVSFDIDYVGELGLCSRLTKEVNLEFLSACAWVQRLPAVKRADGCLISNIVVHGKGHRGNVWELCPFHRKKSQRLLKKNNTLLPVSAKGDKFAERLNPWLQMWSYIRQEIII